MPGGSVTNPDLRAVRNGDSVISPGHLSVTNPDLRAVRNRPGCVKT